MEMPLQPPVMSPVLSPQPIMSPSFVHFDRRPSPHKQHGIPWPKSFTDPTPHLGGKPFVLK